MLKKTIRLLIITALIMLIPIIASQFVEGWAWSTFDWTFAAVMIFGTGVVFEIGRSMNPSILYRAGFGLALLAGFLLIWVTGAVGIIGSEDNPVNLMYLAVVVICFLAAISVRFQPRALSKIMFTGAFGIALIPLIALILKNNFQEIPEAVGVVGVLALNTFFVVLFIGSGLLFKQSTEPKPLQQ